MDDFITILSIVFTFFAGILIIAFNKEKKMQQVLLGSILLILSWYVFVYLAVLNSWIIWFPYLLRIGKPFYIAVPPLAYLYIKFSVLKKDKLTKSDYLHFIPVVIVFADVLYYYFKNYGQIGIIVHQIINHVKDGPKIARGLIPGAVFLVLKALQCLIYAGLTSRLLYLLHKKELLSKLRSQKRRWLIQFSVFIIAFHLLTAYNSCQPYFNLLFLANIDKLNPLFMSRLLLLMMTVLIFFYPSIIYSAPEQGKSFGDIENKPALKKGKPCPEIQSDRLTAYLKRIEELSNDSRFFKSAVTVTELAAHLQLPVRHLTHILNNHYQMRYTDFINGYRIRYIIKQFENGFLKELTMEAIAYEAGFSSRTTFFTAFKKYTGKSPSQYLKASDATSKRDFKTEMIYKAS